MTTNNENRTGKPDEGTPVGRDGQNNKTHSEHQSFDEKKPVKERPDKSGFTASGNDNDRPRRSFGSDNSQDRPRRSFGSDSSQDRPRRSFGSDSSQDRPRRSFGDHGNSFGSSGSDRPRRPYGSDNSQDRPRRTYGSDSSQDRPRRSFGDHGNSFGSSGSDRPRRPYGSDNSQDRPRRTYGSDSSQDRPRRNYGDRGSSFGNDNADRSRPRFNSNDSLEEARNDFRPRRPRIKRSSADSSAFSPGKDFTVPKYAPVLDPDTPMRLNKYLSNAGICSRREADEFIQAGVVKVNGEVVSELGVKIKLTDEIMFHDQTVSIERKVYVLLNKPKDCVTTSDDPQERLTVMDLVKNACHERIYPVGRLDRNTTGVLLLTNDGDLASKLSHPKYEKRKIYQATLDKDLSEEDMQKVAQGILLDDEKIAVDEISYVSLDQKNVIGIEIHSGQNRVVRRTFEQVGYKVYKLDRVYFAGLTKKNLPRGRWRYLSDKEVSLLKMGAFV